MSCVHGPGDSLFFRRSLSFPPHRGPMGHERISTLFGDPDTDEIVKGFFLLCIQEQGSLSVVYDILGPVRHTEQTRRRKENLVPNPLSRPPTSPFSQWLVREGIRPSTLTLVSTHLTLAHQTCGPRPVSRTNKGRSSVSGRRYASLDREGDFRDVSFFPGSVWAQSSGVEGRTVSDSHTEGCLK